MTCKDCIHYTSHRHFDPLFDEVYTDEDVEYLCPEFKDKSRFVELTCKVGDTIYHVDTYKGATIKANVVSEIRITDKGTAYFAMMEDGVFAFRSEEIGHCVFLTREEAEKKLEEMKR